MASASTSTSTSTSRTSTSCAARIATAATTLYSDNQSFIAEIRRALGTIKGIGVDLEKDGQSEKVKQLEDAVLELLETYDDVARFSEVIQAVGGSYQPRDQPTDFKQLLEDEAARLKGQARLVQQSNPFYRQFKEAIWNVHNAGEPMPGEEQEDIIMTSTQSNLLNITCPLTGKPVVELESPVRCMDCKHIYEKAPIINYIRTAKGQPRCPVAGCPKILQAARVVCDPLLLVEIDEMRSAEKASAPHTMIEDFTELDDD